MEVTKDRKNNTRRRSQRIINKEQKQPSKGSNNIKVNYNTKGSRKVGCESDENTYSRKAVAKNATKTILLSTSTSLLAATPHCVRRRRKEKLESPDSSSHENSESDDDFSKSESEYEMVDDESDLESEASSSHEDDSCSKEFSPQKPHRIRRSIKKELNTSETRRKLNFDDNEHEKYTINPDEFFLTKKRPTANDTFKDFKNITIKQADMDELLRSNYVKHEEEIESLYNEYKSNFEKWMFYLSQNFNILLYGLGSKIKLLSMFISESLKDSCVVRVKGYSPMITIKSIIKKILTDIFHLKSCPADTYDAVELIKIHLSKCDFPIFLVIDNIDSPILRLPKNKSIIAKLAAVPDLHVIATIDHLNASLLFSNRMLSECNFMWICATTYEPYKEETAYEDKSKILTSMDRSLSSLTTIYDSDVPKTRKIFYLLIKDQFETSARNYSGMPVTKLLAQAKSNMLVHDKRSMMNMFKNFFEHDLIRKSSDECLIINVNKKLLQIFYDELKD